MQSIASMPMGEGTVLLPFPQTPKSKNLKQNQAVFCEFWGVWPSTRRLFAYTPLHELLQRTNAVSAINGIL